MSNNNPFKLASNLRGIQKQSMRSPTDISHIPLHHEGPGLLTFNSEKQLFSLPIFFGLALLILSGRLFQLQVINGAELRLRSDVNRVRTVTLPAPRGAILDRDGQILAENVPNIMLNVVPADVPKKNPDRQIFLDKLSAAASISASEVEKILMTKQRRETDPVTILENLPYGQAMQMMVAVSDISAVSVVAVPSRYYPTGESTAAVLGYTGKNSPEDLIKHPARSPQDIIGKIGLELQYNQELTGLDGIRSVERDVKNREQRVITQRDSQPGNSLVTTLDVQLQQRLFTKLSETVKSLHSPGGAAIAIDPRNGEILAMVTVPTFDNNWFVQTGHNDEVTSALINPGKPLLNRAIAGQYPSGSIVKPLIATAALAERVINPNTTIISVGGFKVGNDFFPDWKSSGHGLTNVTKAIAESVNTFFYAVGGGLDNITGLGVDRIVSYLQRFGWGAPTGVDLPSEASGLLPTKEWRSTTRKSPWKLGDTYHLAIGQGDLEVTPLQVAASMAAISNAGTLYRPHLLKEIRQLDGQSNITIKSEVINSRIEAPAIIAAVRAGMREGVLSGSSQSFQSLPVTAAAKTGTAQFGRENKTHAWFTAFAPYEQPRIAITVLIEAGGEGHAAALPVAKDVLQWYFTEGQGQVKE